MSCYRQPGNSNGRAGPAVNGNKIDCVIFRSPILCFLTLQATNNPRTLGAGVGFAIYTSSGSNDIFAAGADRIVYAITKAFGHVWQSFVSGSVARQASNAGVFIKYRSYRYILAPGSMSGL